MLFIKKITVILYAYIFVLCPCTYSSGHLNLLLDLRTEIHPRPVSLVKIYPIKNKTSIKIRRFEIA